MACTLIGGRRHDADAALPSGALCHLVPGKEASGARNRGAVIGYRTLTKSDHVGT